MDLRYVNPFVSSAISIIEEVVGINAIKKNIYLSHGKESVGGVSIFFTLIGDVEGQIIFDLPEGMTTKLAENMIGIGFSGYGIKDTKTKEMLKSAIIELGNMIAGTAITRLEEQSYNCNISAPVVYVGSKAQLTRENINTIVIEMDTQLGVFSINLAARNGSEWGTAGTLSLLLVSIPKSFCYSAVREFIPKGVKVFTTEDIKYVNEYKVDVLCLDVDIGTYSLEKKLEDIYTNSKHKGIKVVGYSAIDDEYRDDLLLSYGIVDIISKSGQQVEFVEKMHNAFNRIGIGFTKRRKNIYVNVYPNDKFKINLIGDVGYAELIRGDIVELGTTGVAFRPQREKLEVFSLKDEFEKIQLNLQGRFVLVNGVVSSIKGDIVIIRFTEVRKAFIDLISEIIYRKISVEHGTDIY